MNSPLAQLIAPRRMGLYDALDQLNMWGDTLKGDKSPDPDPPAIVPTDSVLDKKFDYIPHESVENSRSDQDTSRPDKIQRRLAQNREAARKSRLRKKAYVQQLESSRLRLAQLELELQRAKQQGVFLSNGLDTNPFAFSRTMNSGITAFEMEYTHWVEEQQKKICELRNALQAPVGDMEFQVLVESVLKHYDDLFRMKADAAKEDVFYLMSGIWRTSAERFFLWIGGFRPSELLTVLRPHIEPLTDQQLLDVCNLHQSCQQAEDALTQGMDKLQQNLSQEIAADQLVGGNYRSQMAAAMRRLEAVENFVSQADHLRQQSMQRMSCILTIRQAARALLALGEYWHRLRALSSLWAARPCEPT